MLVIPFAHVNDLGVNSVRGEAYAGSSGPGALVVTAVLLLLATLAVPSAPAVPVNIHPAVVALLNSRPSGNLSLIVGKQAGAGDVEAAAARLGATVTARWPFINAFAVDVPVGAVRRLAMLPGVKMVLHNRPVATTAKPGGSGSGVVDTTNLANTYNFSVRADLAWEAGYDGRGVTVAIVDSGMNGGNADYGSRVMTTVKVNSLTATSADKYGHGSHVAGIVGGSGNQSGGKYIGIAPGVSLVSVKFSDDLGVASERDLVNGLQWVYDNRSQYNIRVVNISASAAGQTSYKESPTAAAVEQLWFAGVVVVVSAGNRGGESCSVCYAPANDPYVITAGAVTDAGTSSLSDDGPAAWSSSGSTRDGHVKPDIVAPGSAIVSTISNGTLTSTYPTNVVDNSYFRMGGTSMSAPMVSGVVALMLQKNPHWTPDQVKWVLLNTARTYKGQPRGTGGIVQADQAVLYSGTPGTANQGLTPSPFLDSSTGTINYSTAMWSNAMWSNAMWSNSINY